MKPPHFLALPVLAILAFAAPVHAAEPSEAELSPGSKPEGAPSPERLGQLRDAVAPALALSEAELIALVPRQSRGICWTTCPHCRKRSRSANWNWSPARPHEVTCADCGTVFPNAKYPEDRFIEIDAPGGKHRFAFYEESAPASPTRAETSGGPKVIRRFFSATADYRTKRYLTQSALNLATLYQAAGDEHCARRAFLILAEFARVFPGYPAVFDGEWMNSPVRFVPYNGLTLDALQRNDRTARWEYWSVMDVSTELLTAYDRLKTWPFWQTSEGRAAAAVIERDLFGEQIKHALRFPETYTGNMAITVKWPSLLSAARVLRDPLLFHETLRKVEHFLETAFLYDGGWWETSPSYAQQIVASGLQALPQAANGYSDPPGYLDPVTRQRIDHLDIQRLPAFVRAERVLAETRLPDGRLLPLNDTWPTARSSAGPRSESKSALFPGFGVALLGAGRGEKQMVAWLNFTPGVSHKHADALSVGMFARGTELLPDLGYTHSRYRAWAVSTMSHNTVVVNGRESGHDSTYRGNRLRAFVTDGRLFHLAVAESTTAYAGIASHYLRTLALIGSDAEDSYLIDIFDVKGGEKHDYLLHGSADEDSRAALDGVPLEPFAGSLFNPGAKFVTPTHQGEPSGSTESAYGFVHNLRRGVSSGLPVAITFKPDGTHAAGLRSFLVPEKGDELFLGEAPSIRRIGGAHLREDEAQLDRFQAPLLCWRRSGEALSSRFAAVHQADPARDSIVSITRTNLRSGDFILRVDRGKGGTDYFVRSETTANLSVETPEGALAFRGDYGWLRLKAGRVIEARLVGRGHLRLADFAIEEGQGRFAGKAHTFTNGVDTAAGPIIEVSDNLPATAHYSTIHLTFPDGSERAYTIARVSANDAASGSRIELQESLGFHAGPAGLAWHSYPQRTIGGAEISYTLSTWKSAGTFP